MRRLRAKLGAEHEALIGTVRNVGYRFVPAKGSDEARAPRSARAAGQDQANGGMTEADGLPADDPQAQEKMDAPQLNTEHEEASAAPADR